MIIPLEMFQVFFCFLAVTRSLKHTQSPLSSSPLLAQAHLQFQWSAADATFFLQLYWQDNGESSQVKSHEECETSVMAHSQNKMSACPSFH